MADTVWFESVQIAASDPEVLSRSYAALLGAEPLQLPAGGWRFQLTRGAVEVVRGAGGAQALRFAVGGSAPPGWTRSSGFHGLRVETTPVVSWAPGVSGVERCTATDAGERSAATAASATADTAPPPDCVHAIDHVVVRSADLDRAARLWRDELGVRLALEREFPARGLRMLFFRSGGVTLEFVAALAGADPSGGDALDGIAYQVADVAACRARLVEAGFDVSACRPGFKSGTTVATVRSGTGGVPTLLIQPVERAAARRAEV